MSKETGFSRIVIIVSICVVAVLISGVAVAVSWNSSNKQASTKVDKQETTTTVVKTISPEEAAKNHMMNVMTHEWGQAYNDLLPQQQAVISKATYIKCGSKDSTVNVKLDVLGSHNEVDHQVPAYGDLDSVAVDLKANLQSGTDTMSLQRTVHEYNINGTWKSSVDQGTFDAESKGLCK